MLSGTLRAVEYGGTFNLYQTLFKIGYLLHKKALLIHAVSKAPLEIILATGIP